MPVTNCLFSIGLACHFKSCDNSYKSLPHLKPAWMARQAVFLSICMLQSETMLFQVIDCFPIVSLIISKNPRTLPCAVK